MTDNLLKRQFQHRHDYCQPSEKKGVTTPMSGTSDLWPEGGEEVSQDCVGSKHKVQRSSCIVCGIAHTSLLQRSCCGSLVATERTQINDVN